MAKELKAFQEASVEAIVQHFKEHDRALCADEAGLGKTIIARGIISELANEKLDVEAYAEQLKIWWDTFTEKATGLSNDFMRGGRAYHKYAAVKEFIENVTGKTWGKNAGTWSAAISESGVSGVIDGIRELNENGEQEKAKAKLGMFLEEVMKLECYYYSKRGVTVPWDVSLEIKEKMQPYRAEVVVLGAFGCGAFMNNPEIVARAAKTVIAEYRYAFRAIEFAVYCSPKDEKNYKVFERVLK